MSALALRPSQERICPRCLETHVGRKSWCSSCTREYNAAYRKANYEKLKEGKSSHYQENKAEYIARAKKWKSENPDKVALCSQGYYEKNKEKESARLKAWELLNGERRQEAKRDWRQSNKSRLASQCRSRQAMKLHATPAWADPKRIAVEYDLAKWCSEVIGSPYHVDHIVPLQGRNVCGLHVHNNLQVIPASDNLRKGSRHVCA